ncbi:hypothetical protein GCM10009742_69770 [Kribbella karoonensis]|uniref:Uncharacterized protein n=1 Tax=Kribbella karoonensis TaxID=324851 RepID=A0ABN2EP54_9ACTN
MRDERDRDGGKGCGQAGADEGGLAGATHRISRAGDLRRTPSDTGERDYNYRLIDPDRN